MLSRGLQHNLIPIALRERVWKVLEWLTEDPDPTPDDENKRREGGSYDDPYTMAINTVRGEALNATMQYGLWVHRELEKSGAAHKSFAVMPELQRVLEKHLDPAHDPSIAVRSTYGRFFPWLHFIDKKWATENIGKVFPHGHFDDPLYWGAWSGYIQYVGAFNDMLETMRTQYSEAIAGTKDIKTKNWRSDPNERLAEHLMLYYMRGKITLDDELMVSFWSKAPAGLRGYAIGYIGRSLSSINKEGDKIPDDTLKRIQALWEARASLAVATNGVGHEEEMVEFGWCFASGQFPPKWSADHYLQALGFVSSKTQIDHLVADQLVAIVGSLPVEAIQILRKVVLTEQPAWILLGNKDDIYNILTTALASTIAGAREAAEDLVNRLAAHGYPEFRNLLTDDKQV
jgi:hypothetical protein